MNTWTIRAYKPGDEAGIVALHNRVFSTQIDAAAWRWKLRGYGEMYPNVWLAEEGEEIIGQYAGVPTPVLRSGKVVMALQGVDAMVAPDYRRRGILLSLIEHAHAAWRESGFEFVYGLPIESWGRRVQTFSPDIFATLAWHSRPLRPTVLLAGRLGFRMPSMNPLDRLWNFGWDTGKTPGAISITHLETAGPEIDRLWQAVSPALSNTIVRDAKRLNYRYFAHPHIDYQVYLACRSDEPAGYVVIRLADVPAGRVGYLVECFSRPDDQAVRQALVRFGVETVRMAGAVSIHAIQAAGSRDSALLKKAGFIFSPGRFSLRFSPLSERFIPGTASDWTFQGGDFDVL